MAKVQPTRTWGVILLRLRNDAGLTGSEVVRELDRLGVKLDRRTLYTYEAGRVSSPDAAVVWGLARVYRADAEELLRALVASRNATDPTSKLVHLKRQRASELTPQELQLLGLFRKLPSELRAECEAFVRFQAERPRSNTGRK